MCGGAWANTVYRIRGFTDGDVGGFTAGADSTAITAPLTPTDPATPGTAPGMSADPTTPAPATQAFSATPIDPTQAGPSTAPPGTSSASAGPGGAAAEGQPLTRLPEECQQPSGSATVVLPTHCAELLGEEHAERYSEREATSTTPDDREPEGEEQEKDMDDRGYEDEHDAVSSARVGPPVRQRWRRRLDRGNPNRAAIAAVKGKAIRSRGMDGGGSDEESESAMVEKVELSEEAAAERRERRRGLQSGQADESGDDDDDRDGGNGDHDGALVGGGGNGGGARAASKHGKEKGTEAGVGNGNFKPLPFQVRGEQGLFE